MAVVVTGTNEPSMGMGCSSVLRGRANVIFISAITLAFALKHYLLSSVLDFGYTASRHPRAYHPVMALTFLLTCEGCVTYGIIAYLHGTHLVMWVTGEMILMIVSCFIERWSIYYHAFKVHAALEILLLTYYVRVAYQVVRW